MSKLDKPIIIGISGGTGSGKTTISDNILKSIGEENITIIQQESYYKDQSHIKLEDRDKTNYDHPLSFDVDLLIEDLTKLKFGEAIEQPIYNFESHTREEKSLRVEPKKVILVEGILIFYEEKLRELLDIKIFVDTDSDIRLIRRILRDLKDRNRSLDSIIFQYMDTVRPAHLQFVEPTKKYADFIVPEGGHNDVVVDMIVTKIKDILDN